MLTFIGASLVLIMIPGPDQALVTRNALAGGRTAGLLTMAGGALGLSVHASGAALGISALLATSAAAFTVLKIVGVAYLALLGVSTLRSALRSGAHEQGPDGGGGGGGGRIRWIRWIRQGFLSNALNPKVALFFLTFLPQFMPDHHTTLLRACTYSLVFAALYLAWFTSYVLVVDRIGAVLRRPRVRARIEKVTGLLLLGFAVRLALQQE
ncbi:LysE family translocator [Catenulispora subtropica]|uniref:LysE family translocator n=1 Tax=Catenulispora subtropica TaxID=450798 RepID=A0ABP5EK21_9ACTN